MKKQKNSYTTYKIKSLVKMSNIIGIFSAKGGVGKTTTSINLSSALNEFNREVIVIDSDITSPNLGMYLGNHDNKLTLNKVMRGESDIESAVSKHGSGIGIIMGSINPHEIEKIDYPKINKQLLILKQNHDFIIVDSAPGQDLESMNSLNAIDDMLIITTPELAAVTDALRTVTLGKKLSKNILGIVITRKGNHEHEMTPDNIEAMLETPVIAVIPEDKNIPLSARVNSPIITTHPESKATIAYKKLAAKILGEDYNTI